MINVHLGILQRRKSHMIKLKIYIAKNATLNILDFPVFYFPNFFHPDPSVDRRSGLH